MTDPRRFAFWSRWLLLAASSLCASGLFLVVAPDAGLKLFSTLIYASPERLSSFPAETVAYIRLCHAVLGAVMLGWGLTLAYILLGPFRRREPGAWRIAAFAIAAWFVPDTAFSLLSGFWPNAVLNAGIALLFTIPLAFTRRVFQGPRPSSSPAGDRVHERADHTLSHGSQDVPHHRGQSGAS